MNNNGTNHIIETNNTNSMHGKRNLGKAESLAEAVRSNNLQTVMSELIMYQVIYYVISEVSNRNNRTQQHSTGNKSQVSELHFISLYVVSKFDWIIQGNLNPHFSNYEDVQFMYLLYEVFFSLESCRVAIGPLGNISRMLLFA